MAAEKKPPKAPKPPPLKAAKPSAKAIPAPASATTDTPPASVDPGFDFSKELDKARDDLGQLTKLLGGGAARLRQMEGFAATCDELVVSLTQVARTLPPPKPTPPAWMVPVVVDEQDLEKATVLAKIGTKLGVSSHPPDVNDNVPIERKVKKPVRLTHPLLPGTGPFDLMLDVEVTEIRATRDPAGRLLYVRQSVVKPFPYHHDAIPADAELTAAQAAYVAEEERLAKEVRDLQTFIRDWTARVAALKKENDELTKKVDGIEMQVKQLPKPPDITGDLSKLLERVAKVQEGLKKKEDEIANFDKKLKGIQETLSEICPEIGKAPPPSKIRPDPKEALR